MPVDANRLIALKFKRNLAAREDSLASVRQLPNGKWQARIGGRMRGHTDTFSSRARAEAAVNDHYNGVMMRWLKEKTWQRNAPIPARRAAASELVKIALQ